MYACYFQMKLEEMFNLIFDFINNIRHTKSAQ